MRLNHGLIEGTSLMNKQDRPMFAKILTVLGSTFDKKIGEDVLEAYWMALRDLPMESFKEAAREAMKASEWMPKPAHLRRMAGEVGPGHRAAIAWQTVRKALSQHGTYTSVDFDDPVINATIRNLGGWVALGRAKAKDFDVWTRKEFERVYAAIYETGMSSELGKYLVGISEQSNTGVYAINPPISVRTGLPAPKVKIALPDPTADDSKQLVAKVFALAQA